MYPSWGFPTSLELEEELPSYSLWTIFFHPDLKPFWDGNQTCQNDFRHLEHTGVIILPPQTMHYCKGIHQICHTFALFDPPK